jgi:hypothetical protein
MKIASILVALACTFVLASQPVPDGARADAALDRQCRQKDCRASRLQWYTDLDEARAIAAREGKRVISLQLLGRLDEELSCANSRFFRVMLYSDPAIGRILRENFVLHWHSVRPVPVITIDIGNGRTIRQTITGNSAHFLLDAEGRVLDVLPGLYSPKAFREQLELWSQLDASALRDYHLDQLGATEKLWQRFAFARRLDEAPASRAAAMRAAVKFVVERPMLNAMNLDVTLRSLEPASWQFIADQVAHEVEFSPESLALMRTKQDLGDAKLEALRRTVAIDTVFNEAELHRRIHVWYVNGEVSGLTTLRERVYRELFLTPPDDPWMGLDPEAAFAALKE